MEEEQATSIDSVKESGYSSDLEVSSLLYLTSNVL